MRGNMNMDVAPNFNFHHVIRRRFVFVIKKFINNSRGKYKRNECLINVCKSDNFEIGHLTNQMSDHKNVFLSSEVGCIISMIISDSPLQQHTT